MRKLVNLTNLISEYVWCYMTYITYRGNLITRQRISTGEKVTGNDSTCHVSSIVETSLHPHSFGPRRTNIQIFQMMCTIQAIVTQIPGQINRQQPVYMVDALGKETPFHLEFVQSAEVRCSPCS